MASNFRIRFQRNGGNLHITLKGDLDGSSAHVLFDTLKRHYGDRAKVYVNTDGLTEVHPFGWAVLQSNLSALKGKSANIVFTGKYSNTLSPHEI